MNELIKIVNELKGNVALTNTQADGRLNSAIDEDSVVLLVKEACEKLGYTFIEAPARFWYDFAFEVNGKFYPVNVKISTCNSADNVSSKLGMFYALTGKKPSQVKGLNQWETFMEKLFENLDYTGESDYYFLVVNKTNSEVFATSLMRVQKLTPNGNNLPFQAKWKDNMDFSERTREEAMNYVLGTFYTSWEKKCSAFAKLQQLMGK